MTAVVGVLCKDGAVIGTDSSATFTVGQYKTIEQTTDKLFLTGNVIAASTGAIGLNQRFCDLIRQAWDKKVFSNPPLAVVKMLARSGIDDFKSTHAAVGTYGALVAFPCNHTAHLCEFQASDFQPELKDEKIWYASLGSAQPITDPFLALMRQVFWAGGQPKVHDAIFAVTWTLEHAIEVNPGGVNGPIRIGVLEGSGKGRLAARILDEEEIDMHRQNVAAAIDHLRAFQTVHLESGDNVPDVPRAED